MSNPASLAYDNPVAGYVDPYEMVVVINQAAGGTSPVTVPASNIGLYGGNNSTSLITSQAQIDNFLGTTSEFTLAQFDDTFATATAGGFIVNMSGQAKNVIGCQYHVYSSTSGLPLPGVSSVATYSGWCSRVATLAETVENAIAVGANGNIGIHINTSVSLITAPIALIFRIMWQPV